MAGTCVSQAVGALTRSITLMAVAAASAAHGASLRCGGDLVQEGDSVLDVQESCGDPAREVALVNDHGGRVGTAFYYHGGYGKADRKVIFSGGRVTRIDRLD